MYRSRIRERTISLIFPGHNPEVLRLEVAVYKVCIKNQFLFQPLLLKGGGGGNPLVEVTVNSKEENSENFCPNYVQEFGRKRKEIRKLNVQN
jgi:hypothetical protein